MDATTPPRMGADGPQSGTAVPDFELRSEMAELTVSLVKGMLQSGTFSLDHPAARALAQAAFQGVHKLAGRFSEVSYVMQMGGEHEDIHLDGIFPESVSLSALIRTTMGEHFMQKLLAYFKRNRLVSLAIRANISEEEFYRFIAIFVEHHLDAPEEGVSVEAPRFTERLLDSRVLSVSVILEDDLVGGRRQIPWRVRMAISRLRKDLRLVPLFAQSSQRELREVKGELLRDITRPLRRPEFLKDLLVNSDLITRDVDDLRGVDVEQDIIDSFNRRLLNAVSWTLVGDLERFDLEKVRADDEAEAVQQVEAVKRNLRKIALRLVHEESDQALDLIRHMFQFKLLAFEELPPRLQQQIRVEDWTQDFLARPSEAFQRFEQPRTEPEYLNELSRLTAIFANVLKGAHFAEALRILDGIHQHGRVPVAALPRRQEFAAQAINRLRTPEVYRLMTHGLETEDRELRERVKKGAVMLGAGCAPYLLELLRDSQSSAVRKDCAEAIMAIGPLAAKAVIRELHGGSRDWQFCRTLLMLLGELGGEEGPAELLRFLANPNPRLREEALVALHKTRGRRAEPQLLRALADESPSLQRRALVLLNTVGSRSRDLVDFVADTLRPRESKEEEPSSSLQDIAIQTAVRLGNVALEDGTTMEDVLCDVVQAGKGSALQRMLRRTSHPKPHETRIAALDALGRIGTRKSLPVLEAAMKERDDEIYDHAVTAHDLLSA